MSEPGEDATGPERSIASPSTASSVAIVAAPDATACAQPATPVDGVPDDRAVRRAALRDLAAMIGVEVFY